MKRLILLAPLLLAGCWSVGPDYQQPAMPETGPVFRAGQTAAIRSSEPPERWWESLNDAKLNQLIELALTDNLDLKAATANLQAARANRDAVAAALYPRVDANAALQRARQAAATQIGNQYAKLPDVWATEAGLGLSWELDLFGRVRRAVEAADADQAQIEALRNQVLTVTLADVAATYIDLRGAQLRVSVANHNLDVQRKTYQLTVTLSDAGRGTDLDVARARAQLESTVATVPPLYAQITADKNRLALLLGQPPGTLDNILDEPAPLPSVPEFMPVGSPASMLRRRPDVAASERALASATARIGVATADLFPTISFTAAPSWAGAQPGDLTKPGAFSYGVGPAISMPIFDPSVYARLRAANASEQSALANFQKVVLTALAEAETVLEGYEQDRLRRQSLSVAASASGRAAELASTRYLFGAENFLAVLDAEAKELAAEDQLAQSQIAVTTDLVTIYRAMGGGWSVAPPPR